MTDVRFLVVGDIHSNLEALDAVLADARERGGFDMVWCLGDIVGYGPDPGACISRLQALPHAAVAGNHDLAALGIERLDSFNPLAAEAARWTERALTPEQATFLGALPARPREEAAFTLLHGTPLDPVWQYFHPGALSPDELSESFRCFRTPYCLVGHSHMAFQCREADRAFLLLVEDDPLYLGPERLVLNAGSVGQPRDGDPRASYALYDAEASSFTHHRVPYDIAAVQSKMLRAGLPEPLAHRLSYGR